VLIAGSRAKDLVQQILTFSRQGEQESTHVQLARLVTEALTLLRAVLPSTIAIRRELHEETGTVLADPTQLHQVLINLCTNAAHAMRDAGGVLSVHLDAYEVTVPAAVHPDLMPGAYLRLMVRDTGHGMSPAVLERIFEPFFTTKEVGEGTGMGLAVVHGIVTKCRGAIAVESALGRGTTFTIYLPRSDQPGVALPCPEDAMPRGTERILFVDDEEALAQLGHQLLTRLGYDVVTWTSSVEALKAFHDHPDRFDLVITDQTMPHMTGDVLARAWRQMRPDLPIILCTGFSQRIMAEQAETLGIDAVCLKPLVARDLARTIRQVFAQRMA
jgi:CheY-like chemotaxis protein